jgi:hypothetical protein
VARHVAAEQPDEPGEQGVEFAADDQPSDASPDIRHLLTR